MKEKTAGWGGRKQWSVVSDQKRRVEVFRSHVPKSEGDGAPTFMDGDLRHPPHGLQRSLEEIARGFRAEIREPPITTECNEMKAATLLITNQTFRHPTILYPINLSGADVCHGSWTPRSQTRDLGHPTLVVNRDVGHPPCFSVIPFE